MPSYLGRRLSHLACLASLVPVLACAEQHEPQAAPIVARRTGGDSLQTGPMVIVCKADDEACVPGYAIACRGWTGDSAPPLDLPPLSAEEEAWCAAQPRPDLSRP